MVGLLLAQAACSGYWCGLALQPEKPSLQAAMRPGGTAFQPRPPGPRLRGGSELSRPPCTFAGDGGSGESSRHVRGVQMPSQEAAPHTSVVGLAQVWELFRVSLNGGGCRFALQECWAIRAAAGLPGSACGSLSGGGGRVTMLVRAGHF